MLISVISVVKFSGTLIISGTCKFFSIVNFFSIAKLFATVSKYNHYICASITAYILEWYPTFIPKFSDPGL